MGNDRMMKRTMWATAATVAFMLGGCGSSADEPANGSTTAAGKPAGDADTAARAKMSAYTAGYNKLLDTFGLPHTIEAYEKQDIPSQTPSDSISVSKGWLEQASTLLKTARAMPGGPADVDAAADRLIAALDATSKRLDGLDVYYSSKAYREDGLKRGKQEHPLMLADFKAASEAMDAFNALLDRERKSVAAVDLAAMKSAGNMLGYHTKMGLQQAEEILSLFKSAADINNPALFAQADTKVAALEKTLTDLRAEVTKAKAQATPEKRVDPNYALVADRLTSAVGDYRDLKQSHDADDYNDLIGHYNDAVEDANDVSE
jgi:hypothetical protein